MSINKKLAEIQRKLNAPKSNFNKFGGYNYRSCEDILEAVKPLLSEQKAVLTISDCIKQVGDRYYIEATATLLDCETDEKISNTALAREAAEKKGMDESQITGAASSYARKYALNGLFCIDDTKDADTMDNTQTPAAKKPARQQKSQTPAAAADTITPDEAKELYNKCSKESVNLMILCSLYKVQTVKDLTTKQLENINNNWDKVKEKCR